MRRTVMAVTAAFAGLAVASHAGTDVVIWSRGPGSARLGRAIDNTTVYEVVKAAWR